MIKGFPGVIKGRYQSVEYRMGEITQVGNHSPFKAGFLCLAANGGALWAGDGWNRVFVSAEFVVIQFPAI